MLYIVLIHTIYSCRYSEQLNVSDSIYIQLVAEANMKLLITA